MSAPDNHEVAEVFLEMADLLDIRGGDPYRARTFRRASRIIENLREPLAVALRFGTFEKIRGVGEGIVRRAREILQTRTCE